MKPVFERILAVLASMRLTVVCLVLAMVLVFLGTMAQTRSGIYQVQLDYFRSLIVLWEPGGSGVRIPVFPGGYLIGLVLLVNLTVSYWRRIGFRWEKTGLALVHIGLMLLLLGQVATDRFAVESSLHLRVGETRNYTESQQTVELAVVERTDPRFDTVVSIPASRIHAGAVLEHARLPFRIRVLQSHPNATVADSEEPGFQKTAATQGAGLQVWMREDPPETRSNRRNIPAALVGLETAKGSQGTWLVSAMLGPQEVGVDGRVFEIELRLRRHYLPFSVQLLDFRHDTYPGTDIPRNFSSRVRVLNAATAESRESLISMNSPLRYAGRTFFQSDYDRDNAGSILQVVQNPGWLTPYVSCGMIGAGLCVEFLSHLVVFLRKRRNRERGE
jgi:hypothetical protein